MIANYEHFKELSGFNRLEEINRAGRDGLSLVSPLSTVGKIRANQPNPAGSLLDTGQHRGGRRTSRDKGVSPISGNRQRIAGGDGNLFDTGRASAW
jgi:hypothetical protein